MAAEYRERRDLLCDVPAQDRFRVPQPDGAYYVLCDTHAVDPAGDDVALARRLVEQIGVAAVPGSSFYPDSRRHGRRTIRFAFPKRLETLHAAADRLADRSPALKHKRPDARSGILHRVACCLEGQLSSGSRSG